MLLSSTKISPLLAVKGHFETILPYLFRKTILPISQPFEIPLPDGDFIDAEYWKSDSNTSNMAILTHGLEGNSKASYIRILAKLLLEKGISVLAWNFRGCSGRMNRNLRLYHSGAFEDLASVAEWVHLTFNPNEIQLFGFSLGGNMSLVAGARLGREWFLKNRVVKITAISPPMDLAASALKLEKVWNKPYAVNFLLELKAKIRHKEVQFPSKIDLSKIPLSSSIIRFDDYFTAPLHGFKDAADYYKKCSSRFMLEEIPIPTKIILAKNDPMLARGFLNTLDLDNQSIGFRISDSGGHCGFWGNESVWL
ncbi:MAG TPA: alpha/beta fold hydrolase [Catalimonadaceae bacterium]|nr:alpha/beta fold hydrolase [Catalimonadaceae bacterium]